LSRINGAETSARRSPGRLDRFCERRAESEDAAMPTDALIHLDRLRCIEEHDGSGHSEPYIWPLFLWVDDDTIGSGDFVAATAHGNAFSREVIKSGINDGEVVPIPSTVRTLGHRFDDDGGTRQFGIVVLLFEWDETPMDAVRAAYSAYVRELPIALGEFVSRNLRAPETAAEIQSIVDEVRPKIVDAGRDALSNWEKVQVFAGSLDLDDEHGFDNFWVDLSAANLPATQFRLQFVNTRRIKIFGDEIVVTTNYEIDGHYEVREPPAPDACQDEVDGLRRARSAAAGIEATIRALQGQLRLASPAQRAALIAEIRRLRIEELPQASAAVGRAARALERCRARQIVIGPDDVAPVVRPVR
jgi:hypothetical protein